HINLGIAGVLIKKLYPSKRLVLITHGIDVWRSLSGNRKRVLQLADKILSVSNFTKQKVMELHGVSEQKISVFPNTIDPFFPIPDNVKRVDSIRERYGIGKDDFVIYTLTRLS